MNTQIIPYQSSHFDKLMNIIRANTPPYFDESEIPQFEKYLREELEDYFTVFHNEKIVGCGGLNYEENNTVACISWGMIHPEYHGQGFGTKLTQHRIQHVKNTNPNIKKIIVRTSQHTHKFYNKHGFELLKTEDNYWAEGLHLYHMEQTLNQ